MRRIRRVRAARASVLFGMAFLLLTPAASATLQADPASLSPTVTPGGNATLGFTVRMTDEQPAWVRVVLAGEPPAGLDASAADADGASQRLMEGMQDWSLLLHLAAARDAEPGPFSFALAVQSQPADPEAPRIWITRADLWVNGTVEAAEGATAAPAQGSVFPPTVDPAQVDKPVDGPGDGGTGRGLLAPIAAAALVVLALAIGAGLALRWRRLRRERRERVARLRVEAMKAVLADAPLAWQAEPSAAPGEAWTEETVAAEPEDGPEPSRRGWTRSKPPLAHAPSASAAAAASVTARPEPPARHVNVLLKDAAGRDVPPERPLASDAVHRLLVGIGPLDAASLVEDAPSFPSHHLPARNSGHALDVVLVGEGVEVDARVRRYFLPPSGPGWACSCGSAGDSCRCAPGGRGPIALDWRTPKKEGRIGIRVAVYYRRNLVQSLLVSAQVAGRKPRGRPAVAARVDYVLSHDLADLGLLPARATNILHNDAPDGQHTLVVNGAQDRPLVFQWREGEVEAVIAGARETLFGVHSQGRLDDPKTWAGRFKAGNSKATPDFIADLREMAVLGTLLVRHMRKQRPAEMSQLAQALDAATAPIQVSRTGSSTLYFPWALVYQLDNDEQAASFRPCRMLREWDAAWRGKELPERCPHGDDAEHRGRNCLCPYGFWGIRHLLEQQPSIPPKLKVRHTIPVPSRPPRLAVGACTSLPQRGLHEAELRQRLTGFQVQWAEPRDQVLALAATPGLEVLYFYCHGAMVKKAGIATPSILVGNNDPIDGGLLPQWGTWTADGKSTEGPLVVINGCETAAMTVRELGSLVDDLMVAGASGVVGTEVPVLELMARDAGLEFLHAFQAEPAAKAMRRMRLRLLAKGNLMGLAYTPYCRAELHLETPTP